MPAIFSPLKSLHGLAHAISVQKVPLLHNQFIFCIIKITVSDYAYANPTYCIVSPKIVAVFRSNVRMSDYAYANPTYLII